VIIDHLARLIYVPFSCFYMCFVIQLDKFKLSLSIKKERNRVYDIRMISDRSVLIKVTTRCSATAANILRTVYSDSSLGLLILQII
jgi:hypothetical protein